MNENLDTQLENLRIRLNQLENSVIPGLMREIDSQASEISELRTLIYSHIGHP